MLSVLVLSVIVLSVIVLSVIVLCVIVLSVIVPSVIVLSAIVLSVVLLNAVALFAGGEHQHKAGTIACSTQVCLSQKNYSSSCKRLANNKRSSLFLMPTR